MYLSNGERYTLKSLGADGEEVGRGSMRIWTAATCKRPGAGRLGTSPNLSHRLLGNSLSRWDKGSVGGGKKYSFLFFTLIRFTRHAIRNTRHTTRIASQVLSLGGFTLLELSLTLFILGLLVVVVLPRFGDIGGARLENSARRLASLVRYVNGEAAFNGHVYRIRYDLGEQSYAVQVLVPSRGTTEFVADSSPMSRPVKLPSGVAFAGVRVSQAGRVNAGQVFTHFYPHGYVDPTVVHLQDWRARVMTVVIPPITGEARVYEGYVDGTSR
jgi:general secretion pathway protein H